MMKRNFYILLLIFMFTACEDIYNVDTPDDFLYKVKVQLNYPSDNDLGFKEGITIKLKSSLGTAYQSQTDEKGIATFSVPNGLYETSSNAKRNMDGKVYHLNGYSTGIVVDKTFREDVPIEMNLTISTSSQLVIKELYNGGTQKDDGSGWYQHDKYVKLYNNTGSVVQLKNFCLGMVGPYNAQAGMNDYVNGELVYANKGYIPAICGIWYLPKDLIVEPYKEITIALLGAIDHTTTYKNSVDLSNADYCTYDMEDFDNTNYYPTPSEKIPTENYFQAYKYGQGNAWPLSLTSPAFFIFKLDEDPEGYASNQDNYHYLSGVVRPSGCSLKVPNAAILDAIEVFYEPDLNKCKKRFTSDLDAGYVSLINKQGHTLYRNVDKEATEAMEGNKGKLVYQYSMGTDNSTDPSGIDAEASIKKGAIIIYQDTNNSTNDFHERKQSSMKD